MHVTEEIAEKHYYEFFYHFHHDGFIDVLSLNYEKEVMVRGSRIIMDIIRSIGHTLNRTSSLKERGQVIGQLTPFDV